MKFIKIIGQIAANVIGFVFVCMVAGFWWSIATRAFQLGSF